MRSNSNLAAKIWDIAYPVLMYYAALSIGSYIAQVIFGTGIENYMLCKTIGSVIAITVVYADYKKDLMLTGRYGLNRPFTKGDVKQLLYVIAITICLSVGLNNIISMSPLVQISEEYQSASDAFYGSTIWMELLGSALVTPLLEELLHRGVVFGRLRRMMGMWPAVLVSALIFAGLHFNIVQFIYAFLLGIVFALFVEKTGKLYPAVIAHIVANGIAVIRTETGFLNSTVDGSVSAWLISVGVCLVGIGILLIFSEKDFVSTETKYVFFDIDGTLWDENMIVPESTKVAIKKLQENGHKAFICTGRAMGNVSDTQFDEIGFDGFIAACGNHVEMDGKVLYEHNMSLEEVEKIYDVSRRAKLPIIYEGSTYQWLDREGFEGDGYIQYIIEKLSHTLVYLDECELTEIHANKFSALANEETDYELVEAELSDIFDLLNHGDGIIEAVQKGTSKATGIAWLCDHLGIAVEDTYAIGDSINDLEMLKFAGHGIAMGNASPRAKEAAEYITTHIHEDGVYQALEHYGLI